MDKNAEDLPVLLNSKQAARFLGVQPVTLQYWRSHNKGPAYIKEGRYVFYRPEELRDYAARNEKKPYERG